MVSQVGVHLGFYFAFIIYFVKDNLHRSEVALLRYDNISAEEKQKLSSEYNALEVSLLNMQSKVYFGCLNMLLNSFEICIYHFLMA